jgi:hypothetical protein
MAQTIASQTRFPTPNQNPEKSILDQFNKQTYLGNTFIVPISGLSLANTSETGAFLATNASLSKSLFINLRRYSSSAQAVLVKTYVNATVSTTGTAKTPVNLRPANGNTSVSLCYANGQFTTSANGTLISSIGCPTGYNSIFDSSLFLIIDPGQNMLITTTALVSTTLFDADICWFEL